MNRPHEHHHHGESCVARVPLFSRLSHDQQDEVASLARPVRVGRGETFVWAGRDTAKLFVVHEGLVKVGRTAEDGREVTLRLLGPGDVEGEVGFLTGARPENDYMALESSTMCVFDHSMLTELVHRYPDIGVAMLHSLATRLQETERRLAARTLVDVSARIASYLLDLPATRSLDGALTVRLPVSKKDVATYLGTIPETLSRRLAALEREGLIDVRGAEVDLLDLEGLERRSGGS
ncbi:MULTISPECIES: Crp/Fnr family transcriptional regulator [Gordonia]|uniref:Crp/Fnr family transcriptional regulator n=1 Tax=Gordonia amicalis TaxID=89053 RepID=A0AAE4RAA9_9ACTN|nr:MULTISPECIES: Crp/Fnr family transcriptional regulator [Gordonia]ATD72428.1 Crp/Fnr family transcriptional regulator [Gordonia sp. 1D]KAF0967566.1 CRP-like cAMP-activated global transcriptional regulator [Gordonia sp. YY1]MCR8898730.1 Crp/Fnr family transcriptional regulator [Gordonia sp. GONU]MCZ0914988.1 Crp/Fnr family transcriptional regulator [Gordonia amicalis]MCZ4579073.1 Crp/Fnr family transcriptional regulator [Gordonia amicalis]